MIKPLHDNVLLKLIETENVTKQGLIIKNNTSDDIKIGEVIRINDSIKNYNFKVNSKVLFNIQEGYKIFYDNQNYILIEESKLLGVVE